MMDDLTPLAQPMNSQVTIDPVAKECPSDGFNYPVFRQLNKQARVYLSQRFNLNPSVSYHLFAVSNSKGWFAAVQASPSGSNLLFSTLEDLHSAFTAAKEGDEHLFSPKRVVSVASANVNIIAFGNNDTRLVVGLENGSVAIYDTAMLFTPGTGEVSPLKAIQVQSSPLRQILPNPGTDPSLSDLFAIVRDGRVLLFNMQLEPQGGWAASDLMTQPISVSWSPKGRHIGIGLQTGDILTFSLTNKSTPNKHIPPTADSILVSLHWLGPGHTFRTSYAAQDNSPAKQHIIAFDIKSSTATYVAPDHPFPAYDRTQQNAYLLSFPKWDEDNTSNEESKSLIIVADFSSVDVEVLGNVGNKWFRQSQDNPLTLPLDNSMDDTILLSLEADLTDTTAGAPIMYAYLNDGSVQGWHAEHNKRYIGLPSPAASSSLLSQSQEAKDTEMVSEATPTPAPMATFSQSDSTFGQQPAALFSQQITPTFGQPSFGQPSFGQLSQPNNNAAFGSMKPATGFSAFGTTGTAEFGSTSSGFGGFGPSASTSTFGQGSLANTTPAKSNTDTLSPNISPTITQEASMSDSTTGFNGLSLGNTSPESKPGNSMFGSFGMPSTTSNQTGSFGSGGLIKPATGFGAFGGFKTTGAFASKPSPTNNAFSSPVSQTQSNSSGFGKTSFGQPSFGQTGFGSNASNTAFGQPAFGKTSFGTTPTTTTTPMSGGFAAFANAATSFTNPSTTQPSEFGSQALKPHVSGGFAAFASVTPTSLTSTASGSSFPDVPTSKQISAQESKPEVSGGFAAFASQTPTPFGSITSGPSPGGFNSAPKAFGSTSPTTFTSELGSKSEPSKPATPIATRTSVFGTPLENTTTLGSPFSKDGVAPIATPTRPITMSPPSSPEPNLASAGVSPKLTGGAFANIQSTPSSFQPAIGFGAFGSTTPKDSPFFKKPEQTTPSSPFTPSTTKPSESTSTTPAFGSTSVLGPSKSAFVSKTPTSPTPVRSETTPLFGGSAFSAFSGASSPLAVVAGPKKSFSDLLKTGGAENSDPEKPSAPFVLAKAKVESDEAKRQGTRASIFGTQTKEEKKVASVFLLTEPTFTTGGQDQEAVSLGEKGKGKFKTSDTVGESTGREDSFTNLSVSSASSSFFEVEIPNKDEEGESDQISDQDDPSDFLTDEELSEEEEQGGSDEESLPEDDEVRSQTPSPSTLPLPASRSASATPQPEVKIQVSDVSNPSIQESPSRGESTTPPGTPSKEVKPFTLNGSPSTASSLPIGLGRPSTRPVRRSPLANAVVLEGDESQEGAPADSNESEQTEIPSSQSQPKTPPAIPTSTKGPWTLPTPPSATSPSPGLQSPSLESLATKSPTQVPSSTFSFGPRPVTTPPVSSVFGQVADRSAPILMPPPLARASTSPTMLSSHQQGLFGVQTPVAGQFKTPFIPPPVTAEAASMFPLLPKAPGTPDPATFVTLAKHTSTAPGPTGLQLVQVSKVQENEVIEEGMQKECVHLVKTVEKDIEELVKTTANARHVHATLNVSLGGSKTRTDLGNPAKWGLADIKLFGQVMLQYDIELELLEANRDKEKQAIGQIKSSILKAGTRREEIARFNKAKDDKDFAKMLKARTLGPEHSETQTQLRKSVRAVRDRVQKLEKRLQDDKKKLSEAQSCRPRIKAPSLDTINRSYRNIGAAIEQQTDEINRLATRISKIDIADASNLSQLPLVQRDARLPDLHNTRRPINVTPHVAVTTAAALNAERSAQKLKKALLTVRTEPLLNTTAAAAPIAPLAFNSPAKPESSGKLRAFEDLKGPLFPEPVASVSELGMDDWNLPEDHFDPSGSHASSGGPRRDKPRRSHRGGSAVRKSPAPENSAKPDVSGTATSTHTSTVPVSFDWGPLPTFASPTPLKTLPMTFMPISPPVQNAAISGGTNAPDPKPLEPQKNLPRGFVAFSTFAANPVISSPLSAPSSNGAPNTSKGFTFAPSSTNPSQGFSFSNFSSLQK